MRVDNKNSKPIIEFSMVDTSNRDKGAQVVSSMNLYYSLSSFEILPAPLAVSVNQKNWRLVVLIGITHNGGNLKVFFAKYDVDTGKLVKKNHSDDVAIKDVSKDLDIKEVVKLSGLIIGKTLYIYYIKKLQNVIHEIKV